MKAGEANPELRRSFALGELVKDIAFQRRREPERRVPVRKIVEQYLWDASSYRLAGRHTETIVLNILPDVAVDLREVW